MKWGHRILSLVNFVASEVIFISSALKIFVEPYDFRSTNDMNQDVIALSFFLLGRNDDEAIREP